MAIGTKRRTSGNAAHSGWKRFLIPLTLVLVIAMVAAACGSDDDSEGSSGTTTTAGEGKDIGTGPNTPAAEPLPTREKITLVTGVKIEAWAAVLLAQSFGEFDKENIDVEIQIIGGPDGTVLLTQGKADIQLAGISANQFNSFSQGESLKYVANTFVEDAPEAGFYINKKYLKKNGDPDVDALKGTQMNPGTGGGGWGNPGAIPLILWLEEIGFDKDDAQVLNITTAQEAAQAVINGSVSVGIGLTPFWGDIVKSDCCVLATPTIVNGTYIMGKQFLDGRPEVVKAFLRAVMRTSRTYLQGDYKKDTKVVNALSEQTGIPAATLAAQPNLGFSPDLDLITEDVIPVFQESFRESGLLAYPEDIPAQDMIDRSPVEAVLAGQ